MSFVLDLDDRRWADLVDEAVALIPLYAPDWTDHNVSDPGRTLIELFAWLAEMDIYQVNRIPDRHRRKFLALIGLFPEPPNAARTVVSFALKAGGDPLLLPATAEIKGQDPFGKETRFKVLKEITVVASNLRNVQVRDQGGIRDVTGRLQRGESFGLFGENPRPGATLYLGFDEPLPMNVPVTLFFTLADGRSNEQERARVIEEIQARRQSCRPPATLVDCEDGRQRFADTQIGGILAHHSVRTRWEFYAGTAGWKTLDAATAEVEDETRAFTLNGPVSIRLPETPKPGGGIAEPLADDLYYLRCRFAAGAYDAPPEVLNIALNGARAEQAVPVGVLTWTIAKDAEVQGRQPASGAFAAFRVTFNPRGEITKLEFENDDSPRLRILEYRQASPSEPGVLSVEAELLGFGTGAANQQRTVAENPVEANGFRVFTLEHGNWHPWNLRPDFDASGRSDSHFLLEPTDGVVTFGDGEKGRVVPRDIPIVASYSATRAEAGNLAMGTIDELADTPHNHAVLADFGDVQSRLTTNITNPVAAIGGSAAETLAHAEGRAVELMNSPNRAATLADIEAFALKTPGARLARVSAKPNVYPTLPCLKAPGVIALVILPYLPQDRPVPSPGLQSAVAAYVDRYRVIGTRVEIAGPTYRELAVKATVKAATGVNKVELAQRITATLNGFFHPLKGGADRKGWPFGRDVYRTEVLQVIDETDGVDHVLSLALIADGSEPQCSNVCIGPTGLVAAGQHQIHVE